MKCQFPDVVSIKPDGVNELVPCIYKDIEMHTNVTVVVSRCKNCGNVEISWHRQEDTIDYDLTEDNDEGRNANDWQH